MKVACCNKRWLFVVPLGLLILPVAVALLRRAPQPEDLGRASGLPLPSTMSVAAFEERLFDFLNERTYAKLGWHCDEEIRDTGKYDKGKYHGTHPAVRVYYSPGVMRWLQGGRVGQIPDGEMIIKEQYPAPGIRHVDKTPDQLWEALEAWTVMVKDSAGSHDGWFWSNPSKGQCVTDNHRYPFPHPISGFGLYCIRCHSSTQTPGEATTSAANEFTFAALRNVNKRWGEPLRFAVDESWRQQKNEEKPDPGVPVDLQRSPHGRCARPETVNPPVHKANKSFLAFYKSIDAVRRDDVIALPPVTHDWVTAKRTGKDQFATSNQCMSCHAGLVAPFGPSMFIPTSANAEYGAAGWDVSPFGEWRWTPMGLAGRDPIFYAQLESEMSILRKEHAGEAGGVEELQRTLTDTCLRCHAAMGQKQFKLDQGDKSAQLSVKHVHAIAGSKEPLGHGDAKYGALARDGVSCMVCHRMQPRKQPADDARPYLQFFLDTSITGNFHLGAPGEIFGPYRDEESSPYAMEHGLGFAAKHDKYLQSSQLCGSCHTVVLPAVDRPVGKAGGHDTNDLSRSESVPLFRKFEHHVEQATYLEWLNSEFENEIDKGNLRAKSCQECHMSRGLKDPEHGIDIAQIETRIAAIQDTTYPEAENLAPSDKLTIRKRDKGYKRHNFTGLNVFLLEMFKQFDDVLGVPKADFMTGSNQGIDHAVAEVVRTARNDVAAVSVKANLDGSNRLTARVIVENKAGHRFPTGVGFRRAFLEFLVVEKSKDRNKPERILWASGRTNELGVIVGADGKPLATEFFAKDPKTGEQQFQDHHKVITSPDQVRIYETLLKNAKGELTASFVHGCDPVKDNRLLPRGWKNKGPGPALTGHYLKATHPGPETADAPRYGDGSGSDEVIYRVELPPGVDPASVEVRATLYYQALPPSYLRHLFETSPDGPDTRRLHYLCTHIDLKGTPIEDWKLRIVSASSGVEASR